jgi:Uma2 family endonuclease
VPYPPPGAAADAFPEVTLHGLTRVRFQRSIAVEGVDLTAPAERVLESVRWIWHSLAGTEFGRGDERHRPRIGDSDHAREAPDRRRAAPRGPSSRTDRRRPMTTEKLRRPAPGAPAPEPQLVRRVDQFERPLTPDEFFDFDFPDPDDGGKQELVDGQIVEMRGTGGRHGEVDNELSRLLGNRVEALGGRAFGRTLAGAYHRLVLPDGTTQVRCPDRSFVTAEALAAGVPPGAPLPRRYLTCLPELAGEILSDHDLKNHGEFRRTLDEYAAVRIRLVWVVDPEAETVAVFVHAAVTAHTLRRGDTLDGGAVLPGFAVALDARFDA